MTTEIGRSAAAESPPARKPAARRRWDDVPRGELSRAIDAMLGRISEWAESRAAEVARCDLVIRAGEVPAIYVHGRSEAFDFGLNEALADLTVSLNRDGLAVYSNLCPAGRRAGGDGYGDHAFVFSFTVAGG